MLDAVKGANLLCSTGLLLLVLERLSLLSFSDTAVGVDTRLLRAMDRVMGPK
jgi:hypothetical protein